MDRAEIVLAICEEFDLPTSSGEDTKLGIGFDSLKLIELVSFIEELAGIRGGEVPAEYPLLECLGDAADYFMELTV